MADEQTRKCLAIRITAATLGAGAGLAGPDAAMAGAALTLCSRMRLGTSLITSTHTAAKRRENAAETLTYAADELGAQTPEQFMKFIEDAVSDPAHQDPLARGLTIVKYREIPDRAGRCPEADLVRW